VLIEREPHVRQAVCGVIEPRIVGALYRERRGTVSDGTRPVSLPTVAYACLGFFFQ
jgi:hypothetical protein